MKPEEWNNFEDVPATHFDGPTDKEIKAANERADAVNHPNHYNTGNIECISAIKASMSVEAFKGFCKGNVLKYMWRYESKGGRQDLQKAKVYLGWLEEAEA